MELKSWTWLVVVALGVAGGIVLGTMLGAADATAPDTTTGAEECPHTWDWDQWDDSNNPTLGANIDAFTGGRDDIPEYNDCQRFFAEGTSNAPKYTDQAFAIFVSDSVATGKPGSSSQPSAVALIRAGEQYKPLGLDDEGFYCLFLEPRISGNGVKAYMAPAPDGDCRQAGAKTQDLWVFKGIPGSRPRPGDVPPVVRWGFDGVKSTGAGAGQGVHYAIVPCDGNVCYVGPTRAKAGGAAGFTRRPPAEILKNLSSSPLPAGGLTRTFDGWHDIQHLANPVASSGTVDPAHPPLVGALIPDENLAELEEEDFLDGWQPVAEVAMSGNAYKAKLNFAATTGAEYNRIDACAYKTNEAGTGNCTIQEGGTTSPLPASVAQKCDKYNDAGLAWRTRHYDPGDGTYTYHCVEVKPFPANQALVVPGTVRWKWHTDDEKAWFRCPLGCCLEQE